MVIPKHAELTRVVLWGNVWEGPLCKRKRSLIACAALLGTRKTD
jgi:alkylhydroperoxidase/carboxymuconolactone decarboxylase family protein YurZ